MRETSNAVPATDANANDARRRKRKRARWLKRVFVALIALGLAAVAVLALIPKPVAVDITTASKRPMLVTVNEDGKTRVEHRYIIATPLSGIIPRLDFDEGDDVKQGEVLVRVVPTNPPLLDARTKAEAQARLGAALADLKRARASQIRSESTTKQAIAARDRERRLWEQGASAQAVLERAEFEAEARSADLSAARFSIKVADQQVASARAALGLLSTRGGKNQESLEVSAPVSGRVLRVFRRDEGVVGAGTRLIELGDPATLEVVVDVLTRDAVYIQPGAPARIVRWGGEPIAAVVHRVEPSGFTRVSALGVEEQRVNVIIDLKAPRKEWSALGDGFRVEAEIEVWRGQDVLQVPASSAFRHDQGWAVFVVEDGTVALATVEVGHRNATHVEITRGLDPGTKVIIHPGDKIAAGTEVVSRAEAP